MITTVISNAAPQPAAAKPAAHPLGNFSVNRYSRLEFGTEQVTLRYIVDMAEIPTLQERNRIDANQDGSLSDTEQANYIHEQLATLLPQLRLAINGAAQHWQQNNPPTLEFEAGQGGLQVMRLTFNLASALDAASNRVRGEFSDQTFSGRLGWQEVIVRVGTGASIIESNAPSQDRSNELRNYPEDMLQSPLGQNTARFSIQLGPTTNSPNAAMNAPLVQDAKHSASYNPKSDDAFARLINQEDLGWGAMALALLAAFGWGTVHALSPGHGKTIVGAYLIGSRATTKHALFLGATTTITHTLGVFALGLLTLFASNTFLPERLYPWLEVLSGGLVVSIGVMLMRGHVRRLIWGQPHSPAHDHDHSHTHDHDHKHHSHANPHAAFMHDHGDGNIHSHAPPGSNGEAVTWRSLLMLGISGGLLPCPSALVVMLGAIALHRIGFGLLLVVSFSLGLAATLTAIGLTMVYARRWIERVGEKKNSLTRLPIRQFAFSVAPVISAFAITLAGLGITWQALAQTGLVRSIL
ncbi:MAG: high-affinity nickel-transporter [Anaerolineae bacterium]|nr:high-affinity nickel-transporter [Anaerolineae bacterium]